MASQCVPPPFAEQLSIAVFGHQVTALERARAWAKLSVVDSSVNDVRCDSKTIFVCLLNKIRRNSNS